MSTDRREEVSVGEHSEILLRVGRLVNGNYVLRCVRELRGIIGADENAAVGLQVQFAVY